MRAIAVILVCLPVTACETGLPQYSDTTREAAQQTAAQFNGVRAEFPQLTARDVSNRIANHCAQRGYQVLQRTDQAVHCGKPLKPEESYIAAIYAEDKLSKDPTYRTEFALNVVGLDTRVSAIHWIEVTPRIGSKRNVGTPDESDPRFSLRLFLEQVGGTPL